MGKTIREKSWRESLHEMRDGGAAEEPGQEAPGQEAPGVGGDPLHEAFRAYARGDWMKSHIETTAAARAAFRLESLTILKMVREELDAKVQILREKDPRAASAAEEEFRRLLEKAAEVAEGPRGDALGELVEDVSQDVRNWILLHTEWTGENPARGAAEAARGAAAKARGAAGKAAAKARSLWDRVRGAKA